MDSLFFSHKYALLNLYSFISGDGEGPSVGQVRDDGGESGGVPMAVVGGVVGGIIFLAIVVAVLVIYVRRHGCACIVAGKEESIYETVKPNAKLDKKKSLAFSNNAYDNMPNSNVYDNVPAPVPIPTKPEEVYQKLEKPKLDPRNNSFANATYGDAPDLPTRIYPRLSKEAPQQTANQEKTKKKNESGKKPLDNDVDQEVNTVNELHEKCQPPPYPEVETEAGKLPPKC